MPLQQRIRSIAIGVVLLLLTTFVVGVARQGVSAAGTLDQQFTSASPVFASFDGTYLLAQTYTAGITGNQDQLELQLGSQEQATGGLTVQIRNAIGGLPGPTVLHTTTVSGASLGTTPAMILIPLNPPVPMISGTQYTIVITPIGSGGYQWSATVPGSYGGGAGYINSGGASEWALASGSDFHFRTYVTPPATTPVNVCPGPVAGAGFDFTAPCQTRDACYANASPRTETTRGACDSAFYSAMNATCNAPVAPSAAAALIPRDYFGCLTRAFSYYFFAAVWGWVPFYFPPEPPAPCGSTSAVPRINC